MKRTAKRLFSVPLGFMAALLMVGLLLGSGCAEPQQPTDNPGVTPAAEDDPIASGKASFDLYCANCHGNDGSGNGPVADLLKVPPPDLTLLAVNNDGTYPVDSVYQTIDGRDQMAGHFTREMPVWGNVWTDENGGAEAEAEMARQINEMVEYIRTLQQ